MYVPTAGSIIAYYCGPFLTGYRRFVEICVIVQLVLAVLIFLHVFSHIAGVLAGRREGGGGGRRPVDRADGAQARGTPPNTHSLIQIWCSS